MNRQTCAARTRAGTPCQKPAGWGTAHPGEGRCKLHGGATPRGADHPRYKHGRYSKYLSPAEQVEFEEFRATFGAQVDFEEELLIGLFRGYRQLARADKIPVLLNGETVLVDPDPKYILTCLDLATRSLERLCKAREGMTVNVRLDDEQVQRLMEAFGDGLAECVADPAEAQAVLDFVAARMDAGKE